MAPQQPQSMSLNVPTSVAQTSTTATDTSSTAAAVTSSTPSAVGSTTSTLGDASQTNDAPTTSSATVSSNAPETLTTITSVYTSALPNEGGGPSGSTIGTTTFTTSVPITQSVPSGRTASTYTLPTSSWQSTASLQFANGDKSSSNLSSKDAAGIGIGAAAAGAIIALLAAFLIYRCCGRRKRQRLRHESEIGLTHSQSDFHPAYAPVPMAAMPTEKSVGAAAVSETPMTPISDEQLTFGSWSSIQDRIRNHVHSFYHSNETDSSVVSMESFERLGYTRIQPSGPELLDRLLQPNYRADVLMYLISWCIVHRIDFHGSRWNTLLPPECVESMKAMAGSASTGEIPPPNGLN